MPFSPLQNFLIDSSAGSPPATAPAVSRGSFFYLLFTAKLHLISTTLDDASQKEWLLYLNINWYNDFLLTIVGRNLMNKNKIKYLLALAVPASFIISGVFVSADTNARMENI